MKQGTHTPTPGAKARVKDEAKPKAAGENAGPKEADKAFENEQEAQRAAQAEKNAKDGATAQSTMPAQNVEASDPQRLAAMSADNREAETVPLTTAADTKLPDTNAPQTLPATPAPEKVPNVISQSGQALPANPPGHPITQSQASESVTLHPHGTEHLPIHGTSSRRVPDQNDVVVNGEIVGRHATPEARERIRDQFVRQNAKDARA
jgi:hypothetical protein